MHELAIIFSFVLIISAIALGVGSSIHKRHLEYRERKDAIGHQNAISNSSGTAEKVEKLEQRVRVLERLATDRGQDLASQIEDLRSLPDADFAPSSREKVQ